MSARVPTNVEVAHQLLDLCDKVAPLQADLAHPASVERELAIVTPLRVEVYSTLAAFDLMVAEIAERLVGKDEYDRIMADRYTLTEGED